VHHMRNSPSEIADGEMKNLESVSGEMETDEGGVAAVEVEEVVAQKEIEVKKIKEIEEDKKENGMNGIEKQNEDANLKNGNSDKLSPDTTVEDQSSDFEISERDNEVNDDCETTQEFEPSDNMETAENGDEDVDLTKEDSNPTSDKPVDSEQEVAVTSSDKNSDNDTKNDTNNDTEEDTNEKKTKTDDEGDSNKRPPSIDLSEPLIKKAKTSDEGESIESECSADAAEVESNNEDSNQQDDNVNCKENKEAESIASPFESSELEKNSTPETKDDTEKADINDDKQVEKEAGSSKNDSETSNDEKSNDGCQVLMFKFVDESKENHDNEAGDKEEKKGGTISLEPAGPDDASAESDDDLDINAGLEKCFNDLENKIASEKDDTPNKQEDIKSNDKNDEDSNDDAVEVNNESDDEVMTVDDEPTDHDKALDELEQIEKKTKNILDEGESNKRPPSSDLSEPLTKKAKTSDESESSEAYDKKKLKKIIKKMTRKELEDLIQTKMIELITNKSEIGELRKKVDSYQAKVEKWQQRAQALSKQCTDLGTVMKKYITDSKNKPKDKVTPVKITRSVGLQVVTADQRKIQLQRQQLLQQQQKAAGARIATKPQTAITRVVATPNKTIVVNNTSQNQNKSILNGVLKQKPVVATSPKPNIISRPGPASVTQSKLSPQQLQAVARTASSISPASSKPVVTKKAVIDVVDLSDGEDDTPVKQVNQRPAQVPQARARPMPAVRTNIAGRVNGYTRTHPAPLPPQPIKQPSMAGWKQLPSKPTLKISKRGNGIVLSWNLSHNTVIHATISSYQLYAYQESGNQLPDPSLWKKVGDVKALPLPMACTLTQFMAGNKYHFAVRAVDCHNRTGPFSEANNITLN